MQPHSLPPRRPSTPQAAAAERPNEFAEAAARLFQEGTRRLQADAPLPPHDPPDLDHSPWSLRRVVPPLRGALVVAPIAIVGYVAFWFLFMEPSDPPPQASRPIEAKAEARAAVEAAGSAAVRQDVVEVKATAPQSEPAVAPPPPPPEASSAPLSKEEIKEMQRKLGAIGFAVGPIDGIVGPQTQAALQRYTQSRNLPKPDPTQEVLSRLRAEPP